MSAGRTVYLNLRELTEVHEPEIYLKDAAEIYCGDKNLLSRCRALKLASVPAGKPCRLVKSAVWAAALLEGLDPSVQVANLGKSEFIIDYKPLRRPMAVWEWAKTVFVCAVCFCGAAFAVMTFNNDVGAADVFRKIYVLVTGTPSDGRTVLEFSYSLGLGAGILLFFNHFAGWKFSADPTPLEVEMRTYDENIAKTVIQNGERKEQGPDVR